MREGQLLNKTDRYSGGGRPPRAATTQTSVRAGAGAPADGLINF